MMSRLVILMLFFYLFSSQPSPTEAAAPCNFMAIAECWKFLLSGYCADGVCDDNLHYCNVKELLTDCMRFFCRHDDILDFPLAKLLGSCSKHPPIMAILEDD